jgi:hypothetical protein
LGQIFLQAKFMAVVLLGQQFHRIFHRNVIEIALQACVMSILSLQLKWR